MTVDDIYYISKAYMFERMGSTVWDNYILPVTNKIIGEIWQENNMLRMKKGLLPLLKMPVAQLRTDDLDDLGIMEEYQRDVIPKGIDAMLLMDDDLARMGKYEAEYNNARVMHQVLVPVCKIEKLYKEAEDAD